VTPANLVDVIFNARQCSPIASCDELFANCPQRHRAVRTSVDVHVSNANAATLEQASAILETNHLNHDRSSTYA
jgi:hypothetical protein